MGNIEKAGVRQVPACAPTWLKLNYETKMLRKVACPIPIPSILISTTCTVGR